MLGDINNFLYNLSGSVLVQLNGKSDIILGFMDVTRGPVVGSDPFSQIVDRLETMT